ncbi:MAG TPA: CocE/NonD family hydrolase [Mycobacteriales bacterium]|nr:CocE/NonD family hydrolase [Mycobacteriales bacterium]
MRRRTACSLFLAAALGCGLVPAVGQAASAAGTVQRQGYIPLKDGVHLEYTVDLPAARGRFPVALVYDGYCEGAGPLSCNDTQTAPALLKAGFAVLGVSIRGTSCSTGHFDPMTNQEWRDGYAAVEWAARQPWSTGHVGMFGDSFPGITQLGVAGLRPPHLDAIAPFQVTTDIYRDVGYPGGIANLAFGAFWPLVDQPNASFQSGVRQTLSTGDADCAQAQAVHAANLATAHNLSLQGLLHQYDGAWWQAREPGANAARIDIPTFGCESWQDDEVGSRGSTYLSGLDPAKTWVVASNGYHAMCELSAPRIASELVAFFNRFVKGEHNGFEQKTPHVQVWHDTAVKGGDNTPSWISDYKSLSSIPVRPLALYFHPNGVLSLARPNGNGGSNSYVYPGPSLGNEDGVVVGQQNKLWKVPEPPGASVSYTTPRLTHDAEFFGSGSANLWVSSTAPDTDLQITLTEVRPDGQEVYVARGWLRASHRSLVKKRSTALAPYHSDQESDTQSLTPGKPTYMRVQLWPFDYVFRKGSRLRLWVDAPTGFTGLWSFNFINDAAVNTVYAEPQHASKLVLGHLVGGRAKRGYPACDTLLNQPCRTNQGSLPGGSLTIR